MFCIRNNEVIDLSCEKNFPGVIGIQIMCGEDRIGRKCRKNTLKGYGCRENQGDKMMARRP